MEKRKKYRISSILAMLGSGIILFLFSCIENDIPYPYIRLDITGIKVQGQIGNAYIDNDERTVTLQISDTVDIREVKIESLEYTEKAESTLAEGDLVNFTNPLNVTLSLYQEYNWTITATQELDRVFKVEGQVGETIFDIPTRRAIAFVGTNTNLKNITVKELQLGPSNSSIVPAISTLTDFSSKKIVIVMYHDIMEEWSLYVFHTEVDVVTDTPDVWVNVAWLKGQGLEGAVHGFEIRENSSQDWISVDPSAVNSSGGVFSARVINLKENTTYVYRAVSDDSYGEEVTFTTEEAIQLQGGSFDNWHQVGNKWNPWAEGETKFWDTGNEGATSLYGGLSNTVPTNDIWSGKSTGQAAELNSKFVGVGSTVGKFAAGNIYVGDYVKTDGTNGILAFGKPYTSYPTRLKGYFKYTTAPINYVAKNNIVDFTEMLGEPDTCRIYVVLGDWNEPVEIRTNPNNLKVLNLDDPNIIAYAEYNQGYTTTEYQELSLELEYRATNRKPKYMIIVCTASKYGDYFTGGTGSTLWVDEFNFEFDY